MYQDETQTITKDNTVYIEGTYNFNNGHEILLNALTVTSSNTEISVPINLTDNEYNLYTTSYQIKNYPTTYITISAKVIVKDNNLLLEVGNNYIQLSEAALENKTLLLTHENKTISLSGWIYKKDSSSNLIMMIDKVNTVYDTLIGNAPVIDVESYYYFYTKKDNVLDLTTYFKATDKEDGNIKITSDMITGTLKEGQNIISLEVIDKDLNKSIASIIIEIGSYSGVQTKENITVIDEYCTPTTGDIEVLVIPISFPNYPATSQMLDVIEKGFFGTESDTGWESVSSYYEESSYGKLKITGDVTDWYTPEKSQSYYANYADETNYIYGSTILLVEALKHFKNQYDYSKYDSNSDGYIDAVYLIYNVEIGGNQTPVEQDFYWAFTYWDLNVDSRYYADTKGYSYVFMGYDFFYDNLIYSNKKISINCETAIHETGHLFNLEDYYDYDESDSYNNDGGYCGIDMMEFNIGDHGPYSKILLDWIDPIIINKSGVYELPSFTLTGTTFLIGANGSFDSIFSEYYLIDFYTLDGLNELELKSYFKTTKNYAGVRVSHINANLTYEEGFFPTFTYNNTDTIYKQIKMLEADYKGIFHLDNSTNTGATLTDFYRVGDVFGTSYYANYKSHSGNLLPFTMEVLAINDSYATIKITIK